MSNKKKILTVLTSFILFQDLLAQSKAMEADLDNEIEKTKQEGACTFYIHLQSYYTKKLKSWISVLIIRLHYVMSISQLISSGAIGQSKHLF